mmetsp:Transcript_22772/g.47743  ORF Transcript_22772/g.47743 Transcript_22772/m.47743 type:complete len:366 (-) Transcript_22772:177-1274(-)
MGYLCKAPEFNSNLQADTMQLVHVPLNVASSSSAATSTAAIKMALAFRNCPVSNNKRYREEHVSVVTASASFQVGATNSISSDDPDNSSSDEESFHRRRQLHKRRLPLCKKKRRRNQQVAFGDVVSTTTYLDSDLSKAELSEMKHHLWYTKQDRLRCQAECQQVIKAFRIRNAEEVMQFSTVFRTSMQVPFSQASSDFLEQVTISVPLIIRGMEWAIAPKLKKRRKEHIQNILAIQKEIRDTKLRARFVSSRSLQSSRPSRIMARLIGEGDVSSARGITSTALNVTTIPLAGRAGELQHRSPGRTFTSTKGTKTIPETQTGIFHDASTKTKTCSAKGSSPRIGHARRRRMPLLWRNDRGKGVATH